MTRARLLSLTLIVPAMIVVRASSGTAPPVCASNRSGVVYVAPPTGRMGGVRHVLAGLFALAAAIGTAGTADSLEYVVIHRTGVAGEMRVLIRGDTVFVREIHRRSYRGDGPRQHARYVLGAGGSLQAVELRGLSPTMVPTEVNESFAIAARMARWRSSVDSGSTSVDGPQFYHVRGFLGSGGTGTDTPYGTALLATFLLGQPNHTAALIPAGSARALIAADTTLVVDGAAQRLRLVMIEGLGIEATGVWLDARGALLSSAAAGWLITVRRGAEAVLPTLRRIELAYRARAAEQLARRLAPPSGNRVVIRNGDVFDSERAVLLQRRTVVIEGERIVAMGATDSVAVPVGSRVIDATGKTIVPGLWDMHTHNGTGLRAVLSLAAGVTTIRDLGTDIDVATAWRARAQAGTVISPHVVLAGFMDGPGEAAGPGEAIVSTPAEARRWVARYDSLGYRQIKLYNLVHPILISAIADETKKRGMRLSGHLPVGISLPAAIHLGFDEIQHVFHLVSGLYPDSVFSPRERPHAAAALDIAPRFDVDAPRVTELIALFRQKGTVIDGTFNLEQPPDTLPDGTDPVFGRTLEWLPPLVRRGPAMQLRQPARAQSLRASRLVYLRLLKRLYDAGVTIVPGTDPFPGLPYHGELEIYERAGIPAANVLQIATIVPARVMRDDKDYGSIAVGKVADLVIVDGKPATRIQDLRRAELVVRAGRVYMTRDLYAAAGLTARW